MRQKSALAIRRRQTTEQGSAALSPEAPLRRVRQHTERRIDMHELTNFQAQAANLALHKMLSRKRIRLLSLLEMRS